MSAQILLSDIVRSQTYKVLAECYYPPDDDLMVLLSQLTESASDLIRRIAASARDISELEPLRVDHARLFVGPYKLLAPPYGSVYLEDGKLMGNSTVQVKNLYREEGLEFILKETADHVAVELEFMHFLIDKTIETQDKSDLREVRCCRQKQRSFLAGHLGQWACVFAAKVEDGAQTDFYRILGNVTRRFVEQDLIEICRVGQAID